MAVGVGAFEPTFQNQHRPWAIKLDGTHLEPLVKPPVDGVQRHPIVQQEIEQFEHVIMAQVLLEKQLAQVRWPT